ncbi:hypothetical protein GDO86_000266 [Hymenochirus boettgeri]|uniref:Protein sel-1 homolog 3 n=1 Tax=Hymenochirus boettgeri TaxID=247094 RepID=A0A8T2KDS9_9PIPI|nr:hypothetical protein GDO86_000266 [Hymenochirus boettgeri]
MCTKPCRINLDIVASSEFRTGVSVFKKQWRSENYNHQLRTRTVKLKFPSIMIYKNDYFLRNSVEVYYTVVRAWVVHSNVTNVKHNQTILYATAKTFAVLNTIPVLRRPYKDHQICVTWGFQQLRKKKENNMFICPYETDVVRMLDFPLASSSEHHGVLRTFHKFQNRELELRRQQQVNNNAKFTLSLWMYLLNNCSEKECGIIHHVDEHKMFSTPLLFLNDKGNQLVTGVDTAVLTKWLVPLYTWFRMDVTILLTILLGEERESYAEETYILQDEIFFNDTTGYLALGGSKYVRGIAGVFGPVKFYRLRALQSDEIFNPLGQDEIYQQINFYYKRCSSVQEIVRLYTSIVGEEIEPQTQCKSKNYYQDLHWKYGRRLACTALPWNNKEKAEFSKLFSLLHSVDWRLTDPFNDQLASFGKLVYESIMESLLDGLHYLAISVPSLVEASCLGYHKASYLLAVMYEIGLYVPVNKVQGLLYSLAGAQGNDRLSLLKLGYKHFQGIDSYPLDLDASYSYYINVAMKTPKDRKTKHEEQAFVETIRLMDDKILKEQTRENDDLFLWLKQNAERGDPYAQHRLAQMYFWGQQGVSKNIKAALEWYKRGAQENEEPIIMYDYAVLLFKGDVLPKNMKLALELMKKAAAKGQHEALNGLGWYYHNFQKNHSNAVKYWRKAYEMGNVDAAFNLGVMYLNGVYPGEPDVNETRAFEYFSKATEGGHIEGTLLLVQYLITGSLKSVPRNPKAAISWTKSVAEQNGHIGHVIRKALNSYLDGSLHEAVLNYILTAESGIEVSQTNLAYLCEEYPEITKPYLMDTCIWRYYNLSVHQNDPPAVALLKMGDLHYYGNENQSKDLNLSLLLYTKAALQGDPQGFFSLAQLTQEGISLPGHLLQHLEINQSLYVDNDSLTMLLYERCQSLWSEESLSPCSLMLTYFSICAAWNSIVWQPLIYGLGSILISVGTACLLQRIFSVRYNHFSFRRAEALDPTPSQGTSTSTQQHSEAPISGLHRGSFHCLINNLKETLKNKKHVLIIVLAVSVSICYVPHVIANV